MKQDGVGFWKTCPTLEPLTTWLLTLQIEQPLDPCQHEQQGLTQKQQWSF